MVCSKDLFWLSSCCILFGLLLEFLMAFRSAEFSENSLYRKLKKKKIHAKRNGKKELYFLLLLLFPLQFKYFIISGSTYFFMSFVIKIKKQP